MDTTLESQKADFFRKTAYVSINGFDNPHRHLSLSDHIWVVPNSGSDHEWLLNIQEEREIDGKLVFITGSTPLYHDKATDRIEPYYKHITVGRLYVRHLDRSPATIPGTLANEIAQQMDAVMPQIQQALDEHLAFFAYNALRNDVAKQTTFELVSPDGSARKEIEIQGLPGHVDIRCFGRTADGKMELYASSIASRSDDQWSVDRPIVAEHQMFNRKSIHDEMLETLRACSQQIASREHQIAKSLQTMHKLHRMIVQSQERDTEQMYRHISASIPGIEHGR